MSRAVMLSIAAAVALAACVDPDYLCDTSADCDVGVAGRCELDHRCTAIDALCATHRRYADHSGPTSGQCFDDAVTPLDLCAPGQPPAPSTGCAASVCAELPSCCTTGWSEACVQQAQLQCSDLVCDTRIAITASKPSRTELWDLRWDGTSWSANRDTRQTLLAWLAPPPGAAQPRLAGFMDGALVTNDLRVPVAAEHGYLDATSVDFDRDGRPTAVLGFTDAAGSHLEVVKLDDTSARAIDTAAATRLSWGDVDHDGFPDGIAEQGTGNRYSLLSNIEAADHSRAIDDRVVANVAGGSSASDPPPAVRSFDWLDLDGDHQLDVVAFGFSVDVHVGEGEAIGASLLVRIDCDPPAVANSCSSAQQADQAFAGAALPGGGLVLASHPRRALYRVIASDASVVATPYSFPVEACGADCAPIVAVVTRDLDGDHALDVIAIDANLQVYTSLATDGLAMRAAIKLATSQTPNFVTVRTSTSGAPR